jgi:hypothetical protein
MDASSLFVTFSVGALSSLVAQPVWLAISGEIAGLFSDLPRVRGSWRIEYEEPDGSGGRTKASEIATLHQVGRLVWGHSVRSEDASFRFQYRGRLKRNVMIGNYYPKGVAHAVASGAFQVTISDDDSRMCGWCIWKDGDTGSVESSEVRFESAAQQSSLAD